MRQNFLPQKFITNANDFISKACVSCLFRSHQQFQPFTQSVWIAIEKDTLAFLFTFYLLYNLIFAAVGCYDLFFSIFISTKLRVCCVNKIQVFIFIFLWNFINFFFETMSSQKPGVPTLYFFTNTQITISIDYNPFPTHKIFSYISAFSQSPISITLYLWVLFKIFSG